MARVPLLASLLLAAAMAGCVDPGPPGTGELPDSGGVDPGREISVVATGLDTIWELAFAPDGRLFLTERGGQILTLDLEASEGPKVWKLLGEVEELGEAGLMGLALHPAFPQDPRVYVCHTHVDEEGELANRVVAIPEADGLGGEVEVILEGMDGNGIHDGCRLGFGPDRLLYVTMGDAARANRAQDPGSLNGKVLRVTEDGQVPEANPSGTPVFTLGHRNPQGLAFHPATGTPWISEHGPDDHDEVNVLEPGANYGWPEAQGKQTDGGRFAPSLWTSGPTGTVAPAGATFVQAPNSSLDGAFLFTTLKAAQVHVLEIQGDERPSVVDEHVVFQGEFGRLRAATWGPDGALYLGTSNEDGRGSPGPQDDRVLRIPLAVLEQAVRTASA